MTRKSSLCGLKHVACVDEENELMGIENREIPTY